MKKFIYAVALFAVAATLVACEKKGALEQMGADADKAMKNAADAVNEATQ